MLTKRRQAWKGNGRKAPIGAEANSFMAANRVVSGAGTSKVRRRSSAASSRPDEKGSQRSGRGADYFSLIGGMGVSRNSPARWSEIRNGCGGRSRSRGLANCVAHRLSGSCGPIRISAGVWQESRRRNVHCSPPPPGDRAACRMVWEASYGMTFTAASHRDCGAMNNRMLAMEHRVPATAGASVNFDFSPAGAVSKNITPMIRR